MSINLRHPKTMGRIAICLMSAMLICALLMAGTSPVSGDVGPKPSVNVDIENPPEGEYYVTLLSTTGTGPWHPVDERDLSDTGAEILRGFLSYEDPDGYTVLNYFEECSGDNTFSWSYYPPTTFKVAIYYPADGSVKVTEVLERTAFDSYYTVTYGESSPLKAVENSAKKYKIGNFAIRAVLTVVIELLIALLFKYSKKAEIKTIVVTNLITQIVLNLIMGIADYYGGSLVWFLLFPLLEIGVLIVEMVVYLKSLKDHSTGKTVGYSILANAVTFALGIWLTVRWMV